MNKNAKVLHIGIASRDEMRARTIAMARGEHVPGPNEPKVWFASLESLAQVLSSKNQLLLELIQRARPASMKELAQLSGRAESNLSRTLHTMERYGLVRLNKAKNGRIVPEVPYERLEFAIPIAAQAAKFEAVKKDDIEWAWEHAQKVRGKNPDLYRRDEAGNEIYKPSYGKSGEKSWEIDHRNPVAKGGTDHRRNLRVLQTDANRKNLDCDVSRRKERSV